MAKAIVNYEESIKSPDTRRTYNKYLRQFLDYAKIDPDKLVKMKIPDVEDLVISYIVMLKRRVEAKDLSPNAFNVVIAPIQLLFEQNDVVLNWKKIKRMFPRRVKPQGALPYTTKDIQEMLKSNANPRSRAWIHFLASTGCRLGAIKDLRVENLQEIDDCCAVTFYKNDLEEYVGFLTPEAYQSLKEYFEYRQEHGEVIRQESPIFSGKGQYAGRLITPKALEMISHNVLKKSRVRPNNIQSARHAKATNQAFRKRFNTILKMNNTINSNIVEKLMGHRNGLDGVYLKPTVEECFKEFKKAIPELTIDESIRLRQSNKIKDQRIVSLESDKEKRMTNLEQMVSELAKRLDTKS
jgi:integrase/recombinase XerD